MQPSKYSFELWSTSGVMLADLNGRARNRHIIMSRNEAEDIQWEVDLAVFENYARALNVNPATLLSPGITEIRIRRGDVYMCGGQVTYTEPILTPTSQTITIRASGFLNLFMHRYTGTSRIFTATEATTIAQTLINESQAIDANSNFGVTIGPNQATVGPHDRTYQRENIKDALQNLTNVITSVFDFEFTYDKKFNTYAQLGSNHPELVLQYPGNIKGLNAPLDATGIANRIYELGSGSGTDAAVSAQVADVNSQINYKVREKIVNESDILTTAELADHGNAQLAAWANPFEIPIVQLNGNVAPFVTDYHVGDYVTVLVKGYSMLSQINSLYRIEKIDLQIDDDDNEDVTLYLSK